MGLSSIKTIEGPVDAFLANWEWHHLADDVKAEIRRLKAAKSVRRGVGG